MPHSGARACLRPIRARTHTATCAPQHTSTLLPATYIARVRASHLSTPSRFRHSRQTHEHVLSAVHLRLRRCSRATSLASSSQNTMWVTSHTSRSNLFFLAAVASVPNARRGASLASASRDALAGTPTCACLFPVHRHVHAQACVRPRRCECSGRGPSGCARVVPRFACGNSSWLVPVPVPDAPLCLSAVSGG